MCLFIQGFCKDTLHYGLTWVSKEKGCSQPLANKSSVLSVSDSWSPPPSARPHSLQSPHSAGPPVRITSLLWIFHDAVCSSLNLLPNWVPVQLTLYFKIWLFILNVKYFSPHNINSNFMFVQKNRTILNSFCCQVVSTPRATVLRVSVLSELSCWALQLSSCHLRINHPMRN